MFLDASVKSKSRPEFRKKPKVEQELINQALEFLDLAGVPLMVERPRTLEMNALALLAVANVTPLRNWAKCRDLNDGHSLSSREIIDFINANYTGENKSRGSYDDITRKYIKHAVLAGIVLAGVTQSKEDASTNNPTRRYALSPQYKPLLKQIGKKGWQDAIKKFAAENGTLRDRLVKHRSIKTVPVTLPGGITLQFSPGAHNELQKAIIEEFLPRFGFGAEVLYHACPFRPGGQVIA